MRDAGYVPLREYAVVGDGRTVALVASDGSLDWLCLPDLDSPSAFGAVLDAEKGGSFVLAPEAPFTARRRYLPDTNVLETTFETEEGAVRVTDAMLLPSSGMPPDRELARQVEGLSGCVPMRWRVEPRFDYGNRRPTIARHGGTPVATGGRDALAVSAWGAGEPVLDEISISGSFAATPGHVALVAVGSAHQEPLVFPSRTEVESRLAETIAFWRQWAAGRTYDGPWREAVIRSALALKLLIHAPSGAIAAAATLAARADRRRAQLGLPLLLGARLGVHARRADAAGLPARGRGVLLVAAARLAADPSAPAGPLPPRRRRARAGGHAAAGRLPRLAPGPSRQRRRRQQTQLDIYGDLMQTAWFYSVAGGGLDRETGRRLAEIADLVCRIWRQPDCGIWEVRSEPLHFTHSKMMCWVALDRALRLAERGQVPRATPRDVAARGARDPRVHRDALLVAATGQLRPSRRRRGARRQPAARCADGLPARRDPRMTATIAAIRRELGHGPLLDRYSGEDGLTGGEGAFLCCSFWLVDALARTGRVDRGHRADGPADGPGQRRRPLRRGGRPGHR